MVHNLLERKNERKKRSQEQNEKKKKYTYFMKNAENSKDDN